MRLINGVEVLTTIEELVDPGRTAVIVIDMQNQVVSEVTGPEAAHTKRKGDVANVAAIIPRIRRLLLEARSKGLPIIYAELIQRNRFGAPLVKGPTRYCHRDATSITEMVEGTWEAQTVDELAPQPGDFVISKSWSSVMYHTPLDDILKTRSIHSLVITGAITGGCVLMSAVDVQHYGYYPVVVRDCVGSYDLESHDLALRWMESVFPIFHSDEVIAVWHKTAAKCPGRETVNGDVQGPYTQSDQSYST